MANLNTPFMIGDVEIPNRCVLAPMAGVTNSAFRTIAKEMGAGLVVMEMISEKGLLYNNEKTLHMLHIDDNEYPMSIQLFGGDAEGLKRAADFIQTNTKANIVDINMGCPVNKVVKNEAGAVMVGRTAMGNPYIFNQINHYLETGEVLPDLSFDDKLNVAFDHLTRLTNLKGESIAVREFRSLAPHYLRGSAGAAKIRGAVARAETIEQVQELFDQAREAYQERIAK
ncbi:hypothetical protein HCC53_01830 [Streptococcus suis]|nr:hypothetical protein [Streptococcus suis]